MDDTQCRVCLEEANESLSIFTQVNGVPIDNQLASVTSIEILKTDSLSKVLCTKCFTDTSIAYQLKIKCVSTDRTLRNLERKFQKKLKEIEAELKQSTMSLTDNSQNTFTELKEESQKFLETSPEAYTSMELYFEEDVMSGTEDEIERSGEIYEEVEYLDDDIREGAEDDVSLAEDVAQAVLIVPEKTTPKQFYNNSVSEAIQKVVVPAHKRLPGESKNYQKCRACNAGFANFLELNQHFTQTSCREEHERPFKCFICDLTFMMGKKKKEHIQTAHQDKAGADCPLCHRCKIPSALAFENHYKTHFAAPRFTCVHCSRPFYESDRLKTHISRSHESQKFACNWCEKTFHDKSGVSRHILGVHFKQRNFKCDLCKKSFKENYNLKEHKFSVHKQANNFYTCVTCSKEFLYRKPFERHKVICSGSFQISRE